MIGRSSARTAGLGVLVLALGAVVASETAVLPTTPPANRPSPARVRALTSAAGVSAASTDRDLPLMTEILARPLFSPDRRPVGSARAVTGLSRLTGIVVADGQKLAIFAAPSGGRPIVAEEGTELGRYKVGSISNQGVTVVGPDGTTLIRPVFDPAEPKASTSPRPLIK